MSTDLQARYNVKLELPTKKAENWHYTDISPIFIANYINAEDKLDDVNLQKLTELKNYFNDDYFVVFCNGFFHNELSNLPAELKLIADKINKTDDIIKLEQHPIAVINNITYKNGIYFNATKSIAEKIHVVYIANQASETAYKHYVTLTENQSLNIVEHFIGNDEQYFNNIIWEFDLKNNSKLVHFKMQNEGKNAYQIYGCHSKLQNNSEQHFFNLELGGKLIRNDIHATFSEPGGHGTYYGYYNASDKQHIDNHICCNHLASYTTSSQFYKGIIDDNAKAIFNGKAIVAKDIKQISASQLNNNLLLSNTAEIDTKPELEIYSDDVKCAHGATVGQLDKDALFYLRSRGISEADAIKLLQEAFADELLSHVADKKLLTWITTKVHS